MIRLQNLDHLVLTVADIDQTVDFYQRVLGMECIEFAGGRKALLFGLQKINLHQHGNEFEPKAQRVAPSSADLCFIAETPMEEIIKHLYQEEIDVLEGPVTRTGATGPILSVYFRDPDGNLLEVANQL